MPFFSPGVRFGFNDCGLDYFHKYKYTYPFSNYHGWFGSGSSLPLCSYIQTHFGEDVMVNNFESEFIIDYKTGYLCLNPPSQNPPKKLLMQRKAYSIRQHSEDNIWQLDFSVFEAKYDESEDRVSQCIVHHLGTQEDFISYFDDIKDFTFSRTRFKGLSGEDICIFEKIKMEKICLNSPEVNVAKSTKIYKGKYLGMEVAVKKLSTRVGMARKYQFLAAINQHDNISRFFDALVCENGDLLFAFELYGCDLTALLKDHIGYQITEVMRGIFLGVFHLHANFMCHGNITPWKVLLSEELIPKLNGIDNCREATDELRCEDFRALGKLMTYCFGKSAMSTCRTEDEYNQVSSEVILKHLKDAGQMEVFDMAERIIKQGRITMAFILIRHPGLWNAHRKLQFLKDAYDFLPKFGFDTKEDGYTLNSYIEGTMKFKANAGGWKKKFSPELVKHVEKFVPKGQETEQWQATRKEYKADSVFHLLKFLRNVITHRREMYHDLKTINAKDCVETEQSLMAHLHTNLSSLLMGVYDVLRVSKLGKSELQNYFRVSS